MTATTVRTVSVAKNGSVVGRLVLNAKLALVGTVPGRGCSQPTTPQALCERNQRFVTAAQSDVSTAAPQGSGWEHLAFSQAECSRVQTWMRKSREAGGPGEPESWSSSQDTHPHLPESVIGIQKDADLTVVE